MNKILILTLIVSGQAAIPIAINTWNFQHATVEAWRAVNEYNQNAIDAVVEGCSVCEREQCDTTVGYGGGPDENGETTLDAMIMDGKTMNVGAVAALREIKDVIAVARHVLYNTKHTLLVGDQATNFAVAMGFQKESLSTTESQNIWQNWKAINCQPNFWLNVVPNPSMSCGPYEPTSQNHIKQFWLKENYDNNAVFNKYNHDTIGMIVIDKENNIAAGTSTNGAKHKIPGRVGDSPIPGAGAYADNTVGAAVATGDGDIMLRFLPSLLAVEDLRRGVSPSDAGANSFRRIAQYYPEFKGGIVVVKNDGTYGAACHGLSQFPYSVYTAEKGNVVETVNCE